mgnify:CR=1 FL=1
MQNNKNNIDKKLEGTSDRSTAKEIMKLATDYKDPEQVELELSLDLMDSFREQSVNIGLGAWLNDDSRIKRCITKK